MSKILITFGMAIGMILTPIYLLPRFGSISSDNFPMKTRFRMILE